MSEEKTPEAPPQPQPQAPLPPPVSDAAAPPPPSSPAATPPPPPAIPAAPATPNTPPFDPLAGAQHAFSYLDPTGVRPTAIVIAIIAALFFGSQLVNALIPVSSTGPGAGNGPGGGPGQTLPPITVPTSNPAGPGPVGTPLPQGATVDVGPLRIPLEPGWQVATNQSQNVALSLVKGSVQIDLISLTVQGGAATPANIYNGYMGLIAQDATGFNSTPGNNVTIDGGLPAVRGSYQGVFGSNQIEGEVTAFVTGVNDGWVWDAWGSAGTFRGLQAEAERMIDNVQLVAQ